MRIQFNSLLKRLRPLLALLLLPVLAELTSPTFAQVSTTCSSTVTTSAGSPMSLRLNSTADPNGVCRPVDSPTDLVPGASVPACYSGAEQTPDGYTLNHLTNCTVCTPGQSGCNIYFPPPSPIIIYPVVPPDYPIPPYWVPDYPNPWDPWNPWNPWHPWDPGGLPPDFMPDMPPPPPMM